MKAGWEKVPLSSLCERVSVGHVGPTSSHYCDNGVPFLRTQNIGKDGLELEEYRRITPEFHASLKKSRLEVGDVLLSRVVTDVMKCGIVPAELGEANCANMILIRPSERLLSRFLVYLIQSPLSQDYLLGKRVGSAQQVVNTGILKAWPVPRIPLEEQKRIVAVLDAAFEGLTRARAHIETNLQNARELFAALLLGFQNQGDTVWLESDLEQLVTDDCTLSYGIVQPGDEVANGLPIVRPTDLGEREIFVDSLKRINPEKANGYARTALQGGELLLCVRGTTGTIGIASPELKGANVTRGIVPIRFDPKQLLQRFGYYAFVSSPVRKQIAEATYGAALQQINIRDVRKLQFSYPNINEQKTILDALDIAFDQAELMQSHYRTKLQDLDDLRQSLLARAFAGELT